MLFVIFLEGIIFYSFYKNTNKNINTLLIHSTQSDVLSLQYYIQNNLQRKDNNEVVSHLNYIIANNPVIKYIYLFNTKKQTNSFQATHQCLPISKIATADLFTQSCYKFSTKIYDKGSAPKYYYIYISLDKKYIQSLLIKELHKHVLLFIIAILLFSSLFWILFLSYIIKPLEELRKYAYYNDKPPKYFFIQEIESIRHSMHLTFHRLKQEQQKLYDLSTRDQLSGLYNRLSLMEKLNWLISKTKRENGEFAIIFLDLDNFKNINDSKGHEFGDSILIHIAKTLLKITRDNDIVSRLGSDEFVIVLSEYEDENKIIEVTRRLQERLSDPFRINDEDYHVTASMGIAIYPKDGKNVKTLLKNADTAMYKSKELGKNNYQFFTDTINQIVQERIHIQKIIKDALQNNKFKLFYQPKVDIKTNKIIGCEALVRLIDPEKGIISPYKFIPIAEKSFTIIPLGDWILKEAVSQIQKWQKTPLKNLKISINLSDEQFKDSELLHKIETFTKNIDRSKLDIEFTESVLTQQFDERLNIIKNIKKLGISLFLDDFGTGYSSLSYLKDIPLDTLKINKSFIDNIKTKADLTFINMIIGIADDLNLDVVAKGVETLEQLQLLKAVNCEQYQGFLCSKPVCAKEFEELFNKKCV